MKKKKLPTKFRDFCLMFSSMSDKCIQKNLQKLNNATRPEWFCGREVPENLNGISFGQYSDLCKAAENAESDGFALFYNVANAIFPDLTESEMNVSPAYDVWGICNFAIKEIDRINKLFSSIRAERTSEEVIAGIDKMQFGTFGILDWYAKRMGITDQNEVNSIAWVRIWQCMKNDTEEAEFNRRLHKIYNEKMRTRSGARK